MHKRELEKLGWNSGVFSKPQLPKGSQDALKDMLGGGGSDSDDDGNVTSGAEFAASASEPDSPAAPSRKSKKRKHADRSSHGLP